MQPEAYHNSFKNINSVCSNISPLGAAMIKCIQLRSVFIMSPLRAPIGTCEPRFTEFTG